MMTLIRNSRNEKIIIPVNAIAVPFAVFFSESRKNSSVISRKIWWGRLLIIGFGFFKEIYGSFIPLHRILVPVFY